MSKRKVSVETPVVASAPAWIPAYAALNTILLAFFINLSVQGLASKRDLGYSGIGMGAFREGFTAKGLPGLATGARRIISLFTMGGKFMLKLDDPKPGAQQPVDTTRLDPPKRDMGNTNMEVEKAMAPVALPLDIPQSAKLNKDSRAKIRSAAQIVRQKPAIITVQATVIGDPADDQNWAQAMRWAMLVGKQLTDGERLPADNVRIAGQVMPAASTGTAQSSITLLIQPPKKLDRERPPTNKTQMQYRFTNSEG